MKMEDTECSETSAYKIQTPGNYPEENLKHSEHGESLKSRIGNLFHVEKSHAWESDKTTLQLDKPVSLLPCTKEKYYFVCDSKECRLKLQALFI